jgi:hypothetical protein
VRERGPGGALKAVAWSGTTLVAVGDSTIVSSSDGAHWTVRNSPTFTQQGVTWTGSQFVVVGDFADVLTSPDGITWTGRGVASSNDLQAVAASPSIIVAVGQSGTIFSSADGVTWTSRTSNTTNFLNGVIWSGTQFVVVGASGTVLTSPDGISWTTRTSGVTSSLQSVASNTNGSMYVAVASGSSPAIISSPDAINWTPRPAVTGSFNSVVWNGTGNFFLAVGFGGLTATSPDGATWTTQTNSGNGVGMDVSEGVVWTGTQFVNVGETTGSVGTVYTSPNGTAWTLRAQDATFKAIASSGSRFVVVTDAAGYSATSTDGLAWSFGGIGLQGGTFTPFNDVVWHAATSQFIAVTTEAANNRFAVSTDGTTWTRAVSNVGGAAGALASSGTLIVHAGVSFTGIQTSPDGVTWTARTNPTTGPLPLKGVGWTGTQFIIVGNSGTILTSTDGATWTQRVSNVTAALNGAGACGTVNVAVGDSGTIVASSDGVTWTPRTSGVTASLKHVRCLNGQFVALGSGTILLSSDGLTWTKDTTDALNFVDAAATSTRKIAVGGPGIIVTSP